MSDPLHDRPLRRSHRRDASVRTVSRVTRAVAALAVLGTAAVGGVAAAGTNPTASPPASNADIASVVSAPQDRAGLAVPTYAPAPSAQAPVASSGGS